MNNKGSDHSQRLRCVSISTMLFMFMVQWFVTVDAFKLTTTTSRVIRTRNLNMITLPTGGEKDDYLGELIQQNELASAFSLFLKDASMKPSKEQTKLLLNNMDVLANNFPVETVAKFYGRIQKLSVTSSNIIVPSFGSMSVDGPLSQINLPRFESILAFEPEILYQGMGIDGEVFHRLKIPNEGNVESSAAQTKDDLALKCTTAMVYTLLNFGTGLATTGDVRIALMNVATTIALGMGIMISQSPTFYNGELSRQIGWMGTTIAETLDTNVKHHSIRQDAATFVVSYLLGSPITGIQMNPADITTRQRFRYPDAPRIDIRDNAMLVLENAAQLDLKGLRRMAAIHMAGVALDAIDGKKQSLEMTDYAKVLLAALAQRASNAMFSTIRHEEFPHRLLPTLARYGFVEAGIILREIEKSGALDEVFKVFVSGGGVGDAIEALETCIETNPLIYVELRKSLRQQQEEQIQKENAFSLMNTLNVINTAKFTATPAPDSIDMEIEYIPGTDRVYRHEELILPPQPSADEVKALARDVMSIKMNMDRISLGKVSQQTKEEIQHLAADVAKALKIYQDQESVSSLESAGTVNEHDTTMSASSTIIQPSGQESMRMMLDHLGIPLEKLETIPTLFQRQNLFETLIELNSLRKAMTETILRTEATWVFKWKIVFEHFTGLSVINSIDHVWDATNLSTGIMEPAPPTTFSSSSSGIIAQLSETTNELNGFVERLADQPSNGIINGNTMGTVSISGLEGIKFVPLNNAVVDAGTYEEHTDDSVQATTTMSSLSSQESDSTTEEMVLGEGMEIFIEMDESEEGQFTVNNVLDMEKSTVPSVPTSTSLDGDMDGSVSATSLSDILLHEHNGVAFRLMDARRQQMIRQVQATNDRIVALKTKINGM